MAGADALQAAACCSRMQHRAACLGPGWHLKCRHPLKSAVERAGSSSTVLSHARPLDSLMFDGVTRGENTSKARNHAKRQDCWIGHDAAPGSVHTNALLAGTVLSQLNQEVNAGTYGKCNCSSLNACSWGSRLSCLGWQGRLLPAARAANNS